MPYHVYHIVCHTVVESTLELEYAGFMVRDQGLVISFWGLRLKSQIVERVLLYRCASGFRVCVFEQMCQCI